MTTLNLSHQDASLWCLVPNDVSIEDFELGPGERRTVGTVGAGDGTHSSEEENRILLGIRRGDEQAFGQLLEQYHGRLMRLARTFVSSDAVAEEVVQDTWLGVLEGIHRFEGRSSLKTWIYRILMNRARTRAVRESRYVPLTNPRNPNHQDSDCVCIGHFDNSDEEGSEPTPYGRRERTPEQLLLSKEVVSQIGAILDTLPGIQKQVLVLRDVEGLTNVEVAQMLNITETNERVILHRARCKVRQGLAPYLREEVEVQ